MKITVQVEVPDLKHDRLYCEYGAGQYDNMIGCQFSDWKEKEKKNYCNLFHTYLKTVNLEVGFYDAVPCSACLRARKESGKRKT